MAEKHDAMVKNNKLVGLDIDLVQAIAKRTGYKVEFQGSLWGNLLPGLIPGLGATQFDLVASAVTIIRPSGVVVVGYEGIMTGFEALKAGTIDGVIYPIPETQYILFTNPSLAAMIVAEIYAGPIVGEAHEPYGFAFPENSALREVVNGGLRQIMGDGTYARIYRKWLGVEPWSMP
jgi:ABC-type amino acid transport substrate-binding protein